MRRKKKKQILITPAMAEQCIKKNNFWLAFQKLCEKVGKTKEYFGLVRNRDADATPEQKKAFIKKMTRLLAFNYDVHRCPHPCGNRRLLPADREGAEPLIYPPQWSEQ